MNKLICFLMISGLFVSKAPAQFEAEPFGAENDHSPRTDVYAESVNLTSSNLPILIIETENEQGIPDEPKINAYMGIIYTPGATNYLSDDHNHYSGTIGIELRGNSTQSFPKKPYAIETRDSSGGNLNVPLFGWPKENDWVLNPSYLDHTFIRNALASHLSRQMGHWASRCKMVEVVLNGDYQGIYVFMEKIKRDNGRLDLATLNPDEINDPDITGGYIYEVSGNGDNHLGHSRGLKYPKYEEAAPEQISYITQYDDEFRNSMGAFNPTKERAQYSSWIDINSFVDELIVQEAMRNSDAYGWSSYFHKDKEEKLKAGPVWDFDQSAGNSSYPDNGVVDGWMVTHPNTSNTPFFWPLLFQDSVFLYQVKVRWETLRADAFKTEKLHAFIDSIADILSEPQTREFSKWPVLGEWVWRETDGYAERDTYQKEVDYLKKFLTERWTWMDVELAKVNRPASILGLFDQNEVSIFPNPARNRLTFKGNKKGASNVSVWIYDNSGKLMQRPLLVNQDDKNATVTCELGNSYEPGLYLYQLFMDGELMASGKFIKVD